MRRSWLASMIIAAGLSTPAAFGQDTLPEAAPPVPELPAFRVAPAADYVAPPLQEVKSSSKLVAPAGQAAPPVKEVSALPTAAYDVPVGPRSRLSAYGSMDYLLWWMKKGNAPVLATQGDPADTPTGALGQPGTIPLWGGERIGANPFNGGRFKLGIWLNSDWALEGSYFFLAQRHASFRTSNNGDPAGTTTLNVPFFNADGNFEDAFQLALPGNQSGSIAIRTAHRLEGAELNLRTNWFETDRARVSLIGGFRYLALYESLDLEARADFLAVPPGAVNTTFVDSFATRNRFFGGQLGVDAEFTRGNWVLNVLGKVAIGGMNQRVNIAGATTNVDPINGTVVTPGGLFSAPSNFGQHERSQFAVIPEVGVNLGYQISRNWTATVGYTFLYVSNVVRPGDQIDRGLNFQAPANGPTRPEFSFRNSDFWAQGINFGLQFRY